MSMFLSQKLVLFHVINSKEIHVTLLCVSYAYSLLVALSGKSLHDLAAIHLLIFVCQYILVMNSVCKEILTRCDVLTTTLGIK